jgi:CheY-like chemotaxis protein
LTTTLLAVDDSKTMRKVIEITFSGDDFRLLLCASADEALAKLGERPSVALLDAGLGGYELCRRLKAAQPGLGVVILSNKQQPYDRTLGSQVGADDFADKPFDTQQLIDKVNTLAKKAAGQPAAAPAPVAASAPVGAPPAPAPAQPVPARSPAATTLAYGTSVAAAPAPVAAPAPATAPPPVATRISTAPGIQASPAAFPSRAPAPTVLGAQAAADAARAAAVPAPSAVSAAVASNGADFAQKLSGLGLSAAQVEGVLALSREVVERVVWEVVPTLAETIIREEIQRLTKE